MVRENNFFKKKFLLILFLYLRYSGECYVGEMWAYEIHGTLVYQVVV